MDRSRNLVTCRLESIGIDFEIELHATTSYNSAFPIAPSILAQTPRIARPQCIRTCTPKKCRRVRLPRPRPTLHTSESPHESPRTLLTHAGCADVVAALDECHARGFLWKVTGNCTDAKYKVNMCLRGLRLEKTRQNREAAKEKREHIKKVWAELDADKYTEAERQERMGLREERKEDL